MSGGHFDRRYYQLEMLADDIEGEFVNDGKYMEESWEAPGWDKKRKMIEQDRIGDASEEERPIILKEVRSLIEDLRKLSKRAKVLEWYMSGDTGATSYLEKLKKEDLI